MDKSIGILMNTSDHFTQIANALGVESGSADFALAHDFWSAISVAIGSAWPDCDPRVPVHLEEAVVWRILSRRMLRELGTAGVFQSRDKGAASGTHAVHPGINMLAKTYERLRRIMDEFTPPEETVKTKTATGLPMRMMKVLEETEGFLEHALGLKPGEKSAFSPRLHRNGDQRSDGAV